ncbi:MAG: DNA-3-methyladenine glycosylase I [Planctomycetota bacterium]
MSREPVEGLVVVDGTARCWWCVADPVYQRYHDEEWGRPEATDQRLFEKVCLEGFQAGLSWLTILRKRERFREVFHDFDYERVARFDDRRVERLLLDPGIVRHRGKIESTIGNARRALELVAEFGSLAAYFWQFESKPQAPARKLTKAILTTRTTTPEAVALSRDLKRRGWKFVGPTGIYAFMQAMGLVNDHLHGCALRPDVDAARRAFRRPSSGSR